MSGVPVDVVNPGVRVMKRMGFSGDEHQVDIRIGACGSPRVGSDKSERQD